MNSLIRKCAGVLALIAAMLLLLAGWNFRPVQAELTETKTVTASFSPSSVQNGQEVTLTVGIQGWFGGAQLIVDYDADKLSYIDGSAASNLGMTINDSIRGQFNMLYVNTSGIDLGDQAFFTARFRVNAGAGESLNVSFSKTDICSTDTTQGFYPVDVQVQPLTVTDTAPETSNSETSTPGRLCPGKFRSGSFPIFRGGIHPFPADRCFRHHCPAPGTESAFGFRPSRNGDLVQQ